VGRGTEESHCFLVLEGEDELALGRLAMFARVSDGFQLAEADMRARGEGQLFGERQSGLGDLDVASLLRDRALLEEARTEAQSLLAARGEGMSGGALDLLFEAAEDRFGSKIGWMDRL
jgi:ATP-dependent DNA helicase RecG